MGLQKQWHLQWVAALYCAYQQLPRWTLQCLIEVKACFTLCMRSFVNLLLEQTFESFRTLQLLALLMHLGILNAHYDFDFSIRTLECILLCVE